MLLFDSTQSGKEGKRPISISAEQSNIKILALLVIDAAKNINISFPTTISIRYQYNGPQLKSSWVAVTKLHRWKTSYTFAVMWMHAHVFLSIHNKSMHWILAKAFLLTNSKLPETGAALPNCHNRTPHHQLLLLFLFFRWACLLRWWPISHITTSLSLGPEKKCTKVSGCSSTD